MFRSDAPARACGRLSLGSIPFGLLLTRLAGLGDIRAIGSGNIGATNVLRTGRKDLALATLILDSGKAGIACLIFGALISTPAGPVAGGAAFLGHCFPVWLKFNGGKGVATFLGTLLAASWPVGLMTCAGLAGHGAAVPHFQPRPRLVAAAAHPGAGLCVRARRRRLAGPFPRGADVLAARRQYPALIKGEEPRIGADKKAMKRRPLSVAELRLARLARTSGVGPVTFAKLIERFGAADAALEALPAPGKTRRTGQAAASRLARPGG
jgi:glycerol-3-phosphate acyltransferase PlsY